MTIVKLIGFTMLIVTVVRSVLKFQSAVDRIVAMQHKQKKAPQQKGTGAKIIDLGLYRSWRDVVNIYESTTETTGKERNA